MQSGLYQGRGLCTSYLSLAADARLLDMYQCGYRHESGIADEFQTLLEVLFQACRGQPQGASTVH